MYFQTLGIVYLSVQAGMNSTKMPFSKVGVPHMLLIGLFVCTFLPVAGAQNFDGLFRCAEGSLFFASGDAKSVTLHAFSKSWTLAAVGGGYYKSDDVTFWIKGNVANIQRGIEIEFQDCVLTPPSPRHDVAPEALKSPIEQPSPHIVKGAVIYRERISLRPTAVLVVRLEEVLEQDGHPTKIEEQHYPVRHQPRRPKKQVPIPFELRYDPNRIQPSLGYQLSAHIEDGGRILLVTGTPSPVITGYPNHANLLLERPSTTSEKSKKKTDHHSQTRVSNQ
jgi:putative lipoprotein